MRLVKHILISILLGVPLAFFFTFLLTPLLWALEPLLKVELAGHSGPSDWIFIVDYVLFPIIIFLLLRKSRGPK